MKLLSPKTVFLLLAFMLAVAACSKPPASPAKTGEGSPPAPVSAHHDGKPIDLGSASAGPFAIQVSRDEAPFTPGKDAPIDVIVTSGPKVTAVRFWIGVEDAKGSVKALAEIEDPAKPNQWHTHAEIPSPIPAGSKLWVEVEGEGGAKGKASFDPKP
jgi:hypothetical protein